MLKRLLLVSFAALALAQGAYAGGGSYVVMGGTRAEQAQVKAALDASSFDFSLVPTTVTIHVARGIAPYSTPGQVWLDADLLDAGRLAWGVVQHEYAHQVDFAVLDDARRAQLQAVVGGSAWCAGAPHAQLGCERFADLVAWAYWQSPDNVMRPSGAADEGGGVAPAAFRASLARILAVRSPAAAVRRPHRNG
ncbi:MAG TPA: hypothetical protein VGK79_12570 [Gaiellaceae bacterium]